MLKRQANSHLTLVPNKHPAELGAKKLPEQGLLFPSESHPVICIVHMPGISGDAFSSILKMLHPSQVFDLRTVPSFSIGSLNRLAAFALFEENGSRYYDIPGMVGAACLTESRLKAKAMSEAIVDSVKQAGPHAGSIMVLLDDGAAVANAASWLPKILPARGREHWSVRVIGSGQDFLHVPSASR